MMDYDNLKFGALKSPPDHRDWLYGAIFSAEVIPAKFSRRSQMGPVRNQGQFGSCVGFGSSAVKDCHEGVVTSPLYIYKRCKEIDGIPNEEGTYPKVAMKVLSQYGVCPENLFPYSKMSWPIMPIIPANANEAASKYKIGAYASVTTVQQVKQSIYKDGPVLAAIMVCDSFVNTPDGFIPLPGEGGVADNWRGGHAICVVGYDDNLTHNGHTGYFEVKNSWGTEWGDRGYCYIPYDFFNFADSTMGGMRYWMESWTSIDIVLPAEGCKEFYMWPDKNLAIFDGQTVILDQAPYVNPDTNRTLVPLRVICEHMGYTVDWNQELQEIHGYK